MRKLIYILLLSCILSIVIGCKTQYVPIETTKTEYKDRLERDSIYFKEFVKIYQKGDTVFRDSIVYKYKDRQVKDTVNVTDTIRVPYPVVETKEVNRLKNWQIILMILGGAPIIYIGFRAILFIKRFI